MQLSANCATSGMRGFACAGRTGFPGVGRLVPAPERIYDVRTMPEDALPTSPQTPPLAF